MTYNVFLTYNVFYGQFSSDNKKMNQNISWKKKKSKLEIQFISITTMINDMNIFKI